MIVSLNIRLSWLLLLILILQCDIIFYQADSEDRQKFQHLVDSGRLEITTGGWVMTDEANVDFFSMVDQVSQSPKLAQ